MHCPDRSIGRILDTHPPWLGLGCSLGWSCGHSTRCGKWLVCAQISTHTPTVVRTCLGSAGGRSVHLHMGALAWCGSKTICCTALSSAVLVPAHGICRGKVLGLRNDTSSSAGGRRTEESRRLSLSVCLFVCLQRHCWLSIGWKPSSLD
jgi:hypothetical protein